MDPNFYLNIVLCLKNSKSTPQTKSVAFPSPPATILDIKKVIETSCNIPCFMQTLLHQHSEASDGCSLQSLYLRSGDTVEVLHNGEGDVNRVKGVMKWLEKCLKMCEEYLADLRCGKEPYILAHLIEVANEANGFYAVFSPWSKPCKLVNALHFDFLGGIELLKKFHKVVISIKRHQYDYPRMFRFLDLHCVRMIANYAMNNDLSRRLAGGGLLESCIDTFVMVPANDRRIQSAQMYYMSTLETSLRGIFK